MNPNTTLITGAMGHLGWDYLQHMAATAQREKILALDLFLPDETRRKTLEHLRLSNPSPPTMHFIALDLLKTPIEELTSVIAEVDSIIHFAAVNPFQDASAAEAAASILITSNLFRALPCEQRHQRFVFASSNHVMGRYKDPPLRQSIGQNQLTTSLPPAPGTLVPEAERYGDSTLYALAKIAGEKMGMDWAIKSGDRATCVSVRIGACKPGQDPPPASPADSQSDSNNAWAQNMWLTVKDFHTLFDRAQEAESRSWPTPAIIVNGMSANTGMVWSLKESRRWLNYEPKDNIHEG